LGVLFEYLKKHGTTNSKKENKLCFHNRNKLLFMDIIGDCSENMTAENLLCHHTLDFLNVAVTVTYTGLLKMIVGVLATLSRCNPM
jgi:hypothetical protein